ncbi:glycoside hydrolase family 3 N-terminal domain-containing protein [Chryseosolibacter indicus]|uniref:beta-N-acetylhexosaminidase n=1 Tax=Chryseosolibacter indicus TaxID=2782351 RepID=A0ABS5VWC1_9BACT|nr:glycoside hydrolase family 3 N-terminal domain-containing protein [Chryseosolibacter indicus]MBT1705714.1 serine hydrolase [Chryseosolibacter indicus]
MRTAYQRLLIILSFVSQLSIAQHLPGSDVPFINSSHKSWVDSVFNTLTIDERIGQLIMVAAYSNRDEAHKQEILKLIREQKIGGLIFFQGGPGRQARLINEYQATSKVPLLIAMDAEWGLGMRLDSTISFPYQMTLGAIQDDSLVYNLGVEVARQLKRSGVHINFAPVVDVNNNPSNPVINYRSFGEDKRNVSRKAIAYMKGMQDNGILTTAKHFPGHGDTGTDSHYALPQINHSRARLDSLELYPFKEVIKAGIGGVMVAHLNIPALDSSSLPSTLSRKVITDLLRKDLGFKGLIVTDAMNMKGVTSSNPPGIVDRDAIIAGNDMLEFTEDVSRTIAEIKRAINQKLISQKEIDDKCRKILAIKFTVGLKQRQPVKTSGIARELVTPDAQLLNSTLIEKSITVLNNHGNLLPVQRLDTVHIASVSIGKNGVSPFQKTLGLYTEVQHFVLPKDANAELVDSLRKQLQNYNLLIAAIHDDGIRPLNKLSFSDPVLTFITDVANRKGSIVSVFKNPYVIDKLSSIENSDALIVTYQDNVNTEELAAQLIFGGIGARGRLPVSIGQKFPVGAGIDVDGGIRFKYTIPEDAQMNSGILYRRVDSLVNQALSLRAIPGCQVLIARDKKVVLYKSYGYHDYADTIKVKNTDLYDLASVTKISTSLPSLMKLYDEGHFKLDATLADYLPKFKRSNKSDIPMSDILTHQARFKPWIPFYKNTVKKNGGYKWFTIKSDSSKRFPTKLKDKMYLHRHYPDRIVNTIRKSPLEAEKKYLYSDFFFILAPRVVESMIDESFDYYIYKNFYKPLGATTLTYNPRKRYLKNSIVPTEHDYYFRHEPIHGTVHDEGAIMLGGVSGHAGLFGNANDLAKLMQMYLSMGEYGGTRYIKSETLMEWTKYQFPENNNRRGLGFDKPNLKYLGENNNAAKDASPLSFGHTGFTGTMTWMDPQTGLLYIFLSNRVNPTRDNTRLYQLNTRTKIQQVMYDALYHENNNTH